MTGWLIAAMITAQAADITTTWIGLNQGCTEKLYYRIQDPVIIASGKGLGTTVGVIFVYRKGKQYPKTAKGLTAFIIGAGAYGAVHNSIVINGGCIR